MTLQTQLEEEHHSRYLQTLCAELMHWGFLYPTLLTSSLHGPLLVCCLYADEDHGILLTQGDEES